jgi:hypothetical protein
MSKARFSATNSCFLCSLTFYQLPYFTWLSCFVFAALYYLCVFFPDSCFLQFRSSDSTTFFLCLRFLFLFSSCFFSLQLYSFSSTRSLSFLPCSSRNKIIELRNICRTDVLSFLCLLIFSKKRPSDTSADFQEQFTHETVRAKRSR